MIDISGNFVGIKLDSPIALSISDAFYDLSISKFIEDVSIDEDGSFLFYSGSAGSEVAEALEKFLNDQSSLYGLKVVIDDPIDCSDFMSEKSGENNVNKDMVLKV